MAAVVRKPRFPPYRSQFPWDYEGNVQARVADHLRAAGWAIESWADPVTKERGPDLVAVLDGRTLLVEVKGYPLKAAYADPRRAGEIKRTHPSTQAGHWYSQALLACLAAYDKTEAAMALPHQSRFHRLIARTERALKRLGIGVYLVEEGGRVEELLPHLRRGT